MKNCAGRFAAFIAAAVVSLAAWTPARAELVVQIDKSAQRMSVSVDGVARYYWPVSTGRWSSATACATPRSKSRISDLRLAMPGCEACRLTAR
jgi:hypothetical protein